MQRGDQWAQTSRVTNNRTGNTTRVSQGSGGGESMTRRTDQGTTRVGRTGSGDVYAGHDGNVYRKEGDSWQKYGDGGWSDTNRPEPSGQRATDAGAQARDRAAQGGVSATNRGTIEQLNRDSKARSTGTQRTGDYGTYRSTGGSSSRSAGTYRPSSGGARGGGGGRRR